MREVPRAANDLRFGQILGSSNAFRRIGQILSWSKHRKALLGQTIQPRNLRDLLVSDILNCLF